MKRIILILAILLSVAVTANAQVQYEIIDLGANSRAFDINNSNQVVGYSGSQAFLWDSTNGMQSITSNAKAYSINNSGQVVGSKYTPSLGFLWERGQGMQALSFYAMDINDNSQVVGNTGGTYRHAILWDQVNGARDLNSIDGSPDYTFINARGINNSGQIVGEAYFNSGGYSAFIWDSINGIQNIGGRTATDINKHGQVVGYEGAFLWDSTNGNQSLGSLGGSSYALGINDSGQVVGSSYTEEHSDGHAFIWDSTYGLQDLNGFLPGDSEWTLLTEANAVNNSGFIVGSGLINGQEHAFLMTPTVVPEPISSILFITGGLTLGFRHFRLRRTQS